MKSWNKQTSLLRVTTLAAALMGVYGVAGAVPAPPLECLSASQCTEGPYDDELYLQDSSSGVKGAVHGSNGAEFSVEGSKIVGHNKARGVLADNGANITLEGVTITTNGGSGHGVQSHQTNTSLPSSQITINNSTVIAKSVDYAVGILAQKGTLISGTAVDVETNGTNGSGVEADRGGRIELWGAEDLNSIVASGAGAAGARAISGKEADAIPGSIALDKYYVESEHGVGLMAGDEDGPGGPVTAGIITFTNGQVLASGAGSSSTHMGAAARVKHGSTLLVEQSDLVSVQHHGVVVDESSALLKDTNVITSGIGGGSGSLVAGVLASNKANVLIRNGNIVANGEQYTRGVLATSGANVDIDGTTIATLGAHSHAVHAWGDGVSDAPQVLVTNAKIGTTKRESYGLSAQNAGEITARNTAINTQGEGGFGAFAYNGGRLDITGGSITTHGTSSFEHPELGVEVGNYGVLAKNKSTAIITGTKVSTKGAHAEGLRAENDGAEGDVYNTSSTISAQGVTVDTAGLEAHGIAAYGSAHEDDEWAQGSTVDFKEGAIHTAGGQAVGALASSGGVVLLKDARITTSGEGGHGAVAFTDTFGMLAKAAAPMAYSPSTVVLNNVDIETSGAVAVGLVAFNGDSNIQMTGGSIKAKGDGSAGLFLGNDAEVSLDGVTVESDGASILSYFGADEDVSQLASDLEQVIDVKDSVFALNNSTLLRVDRKEGGEDGVVYLDLRGNTVAIGNIENYGADGKLGSSKNTHVTLYDSASWVGVGMDDKTTIAKSGDTVTGSQAGNVTAPDGSSVSFQNVPSIAGSVSATLGSIFSFAGSPTTIEGGLFGMPQSNVTFNNDVHILGQGTGQQGGFALNGVGSIFAFSGNTTIDGPVQGDGSSFNFTGASTNIGALNLQNGSSISGGTGGNPINVQGNTGIAGGSTLGGNLNIQGQLSSADSFIAPGNSIGTISVDTLGSVSGSVFEFEVDGNGQADLLVVRNGDANLKGSSLKVDRYEGYRLDHDYTIIRTEAGNVVNEFDSEQLGDTFSGTLVKLDPVKYGSNDVKVSLSVDGNAIDRTGYSANQSATLDGALSVAGRNASADAVMFMQPDARKDAL
ncbi:MAG: hypothetical protein QHC66_03100, partial [Pusillimonas sp.]|nr:hypothetical protein [Pusillimonas sp.]